MMLLQPSPLRPSLPLSRHPSPLSPQFLPLRSPLSLIPSALSRRSRSPLNRRRQSDGGSDADAALDLDDEIEDFDEAFEERRPRGFVAEGIRYDTSLEERLLKEIQGNRKDQTENLKDKDKVKRESSQTKKKGVKVKKPQNKNYANVPDKMVSSGITSGIRVRLWNLPRKKNIHRDLQTAFKGFRGILHIEPANSGNKKTRDPVCKGFAFVELATDEVATRFVETYSNRSISFGRVEKQISCCIIDRNANSTTINPNGNPITKKLSNHHKSQMLEPQLHDGFLGISENINPSDESPIIFVEGDGDDDEEEDEEDSLLSFEMLNINDEDEDEEEPDSEITEVPSEKKKKAVSLRRRRVRPRRTNSSKLSLPLRLKGRERDVLTGVFSKYSANSEDTQTRKS